MSTPIPTSNPMSPVSPVTSQSPIQLEWMRREMAIAPITPDQSAADWVVQRINLAKERVVQARLAAGAPAATPPAQAEAPKMEPKEETKPEAKQEVKEEGWNGRMDFDGEFISPHSCHVAQ